MQALIHCVLQVLVTGAGGKTGKIVLQKLLALPDQYSVRGLVHSERVGKAKFAVSHLALLCWHFLLKHAVQSKALLIVY